MSHFTPSRCLERTFKDLDYNSSIQKRRLIFYLSQDIFLNYASILASHIQKSKIHASGYWKSLASFCFMYFLVQSI